MTVCSYYFYPRTSPNYTFSEELVSIDLKRFPSFQKAKLTARNAVNFAFFYLRTCFPVALRS